MMKTIILYKWNSIQNRRWGWSIEEIRNDWDAIYSEPYYVEMPDEFELKETLCGEKLFFAQGDNVGYEVVGSTANENCVPVLIGGTNVEMIKLKVIGEVK